MARGSQGTSTMARIGNGGGGAAGGGGEGGGGDGGGGEGGGGDGEGGGGEGGGGEGGGGEGEGGGGDGEGGGGDGGGGMGGGGDGGGGVGGGGEGGGGGGELGGLGGGGDACVGEGGGGEGASNPMDSMMGVPTLARLTASDVLSDAMGVLDRVWTMEAAWVVLVEVMDAVTSIEEARTLRAMWAASTPWNRAERRRMKLLLATASKASNVPVRVKATRTTGLYTPPGRSGSEGKGGGGEWGGGGRGDVGGDDGG
jgi:hypothetical protein